MYKKEKDFEDIKNGHDRQKDKSGRGGQIINKDRYVVYAARFLNNKLIAVKTDLPDIITIDRMRCLMDFQGYEFYVDSEGEQFEFFLEKTGVVLPPIEVLKKLEQF